MAPDHALRREALLDDAVLIGTGLWRPFSTLTTPVQLFLAEHVSARILELRDGWYLGLPACLGTTLGDLPWCCFSCYIRSWRSSQFPALSCPSRWCSRLHCLFTVRIYTKERKKIYLVLWMQLTLQLNNPRILSSFNSWSRLKILMSCWCGKWSTIILSQLGVSLFITINHFSIPSHYVHLLLLSWWSASGLPRWLLGQQNPGWSDRLFEWWSGTRLDL